MSNNLLVEIEKEQRFSQSYIWQWQRDYFNKEGIDAWVKEVPHYATSNPFLANSYAEMTLRLIQDWAKQHPETASEPHYILEIGTGSGQLSYYILKRLKQLKQQLNLSQLKIVYIMSDFTTSNLKFWESHPALAPFVAEGLLEFAIFDLESDNKISLLNSKSVISADNIKNPLTVYCNYIFDSVPQDAFLVKNGEIFESLLTLKSEQSNLQNGKPILLEPVEFSYTPKAISSNYYSDPAINHVLHNYRNVLNSSHFLFPIAGMQAIDNLIKLSNNKLFLLASDYGYAEPKDMENSERQSLSFHGSFSVEVNFHALGEYVRQIGGQAILQKQRPNITTNLFLVGIESQKMPEFSVAVNNNIEIFSPGDYFILHRNIKQHYENYNLDALIAHLELSRWDPHIYEKFNSTLSEKLPQASSDLVALVVSHLQDLADHFYFLPKGYDVLFDIGFLLTRLQMYESAMTYYNKSLKFFNDSFYIRYNIALCMYYTGDKKQALENIQQALKFSPDNEQAINLQESINSMG